MQQLEQSASTSSHARGPRGADRVTLEGCRTGRRELSMSYLVDDVRLTKTYCYGDVDLTRLEEVYSPAFMQRLYFHIMAFEAMPLASLLPRALHLGPFARFRTKNFEALWRTVFRRAGAEWRYENELPDYAGPQFLYEQPGLPAAPVTVRHGPVEALSFNGGGKDSLVAMKLLEQGGVTFSSFAYSRPVYGPPQLQHQLIDGLLDESTPAVRHQLSVFEDPAWDDALGERRQAAGVRDSVQAETPTFVLGALPVVLRHGYRYLVLAHERSAEEGNFVWERTGEEVNHQWGKSSEAELLLDRYIRREIVANVSYFSVLKPIHDVLIFNLLGEHPGAVVKTHSCNVKKPWCGECAKCAYVWVSYMAYLPFELARAAFPANLLDSPAAQRWFRALLGLGPHKPFECVGEIPETRLAFEICRRKGLTGGAMDFYANEVAPPDVGALLDRYLTVRPDSSSMLADVGRRVYPHLFAAAARAGRRLAHVRAGSLEV